MQAICTISRAAEMIGVSYERVRQLVERGDLRLVRLESGAGESAPRLLVVRDVEEWIAQRRGPGRPAAEPISASR